MGRAGWVLRFSVALVVAALSVFLWMPGGTAAQPHQAPTGADPATSTSTTCPRGDVLVPPVLNGSGQCEKLYVVSESEAIAPVLDFIVPINESFHCPFLTNIGHYQAGDYANGTFSKGAGSLPNGVRLLPQGTLIGKPKSSDPIKTYNFNVKAHTALLSNEPVSKTNPAVTATEPVALTLVTGTVVNPCNPALDTPSG